jgi:hypothetical protein
MLKFIIALIIFYHHPALDGKIISPVSLNPAAPSIL